MDDTVRILCVDDEINVLRALQRLFMDDDYELLIANSAEEGLELLRISAPVQIVISDYRMPGLNGVDFLREVYRDWPETVRMVLSGYADTAAVVSAINEGHIYKFVPKPWNDDELRSTVAHIVERHRLKSKNAELMRSLADSNEEIHLLNQNLEKLVTETASELIRQDRMLAFAKNMLDLLPVGVLGIDPEGKVIQCNRKLREMLELTVKDAIGADRNALLPLPLNELAERAAVQRETSARLVLNGIGCLARAVVMEMDEQQGVILTLESGV